MRIGMGMLMSNEPDFMIHGVFEYHMFGQDFWITTTTIGMWIVSALILLIAFLANRTLKKATDEPGMFHRITPTDISRSSRFVGLLSHIIFRLPPSFYSSVPPTVLPQKYGWTALAC